MLLILYYFARQWLLDSFRVQAISLRADLHTLRADLHTLYLASCGRPIMQQGGTCLWVALPIDRAEALSLRHVAAIAGRVSADAQTA